MRAAFGAVAVALALALVWGTKEVSSALPGEMVPPVLRDGFTLASSVLIESMPFIILGIALSVLVQVWIPEQWLFRILPKSPVPRRLVISLSGRAKPILWKNIGITQLGLMV